MKRLFLGIGVVLASVLLLLPSPERATVSTSKPPLGEAQVSVLLLLHAPGLRP